MKLLSAFLALSALAGPAWAFAPNANFASSRTVDVSLAAERRAFLGAAGTAAAAALFGGGSLPAPASAKEYAQQWLTEPTDEFKENEARAAEFRKAQILQKKAMNDAIDKVVNVAQTEEELKTAMDELTRLVAETGGLPSGLSKEDMYKRIRGKKAKGFWPTSVEYAYQELKLEVAYQQSPNKDKELGRP